MLERVSLAIALIAGVLAGTTAHAACKPPTDIKGVATVHGHGAMVSWCRESETGSYNLLVRPLAENHQFISCPTLIALREPSPFPFMEILASYDPPYDLGPFFGVTHERQLSMASPPLPVLNVDAGGAGYYIVCFRGDWWRSAYH